MKLHKKLEDRINNLKLEKDERAVVVIQCNDGVIYQSRDIVTYSKKIYIHDHPALQRLSENETILWINPYDKHG